MRRSERFYLGIYRDSLGSSWAVFDRSRPPSWSGSHDPILWLAYPGDDGATRAASVLGEYLSGVRRALD